MCGVEAAAVQQGQLALMDPPALPLGVVGVVALALGDGSVQLLCVPSPLEPCVAALQSLIQGEAGALASELVHDVGSHSSVSVSVSVFLCLHFPQQG